MTKLYLIDASQIANKRQHQIAILLYGTTGTQNDLHSEMAEAADDPDDQQYLHVTLAHPMACPTVEKTLDLFKALPCGQGKADLFDALMVMLDVDQRLQRANPLVKADTSVIIISDFTSMAIPLDEDTSFRLKPLLAQINPASALCLQCNPLLDATIPASTQTLQPASLSRHSQVSQPAGPEGCGDTQAGMQTECAADKAARSANLQALEDLFTTEVGPSLKIVKVEHPEQMLGMFKIKEVTSSTTHKPTLCISQNGPEEAMKMEDKQKGSILRASTAINIHLNVYKRVAVETCPALKKYSERAMELGQDFGPTSNVVVSEIICKLDDDATKIDIGQTVSAYKYGKQLCPVKNSVFEDLVKSLDPPEAHVMRLMYCIMKTELPASQRLGHASIALPWKPVSKDKAHDRNWDYFLAVSALVQALHSQEKYAVVRYRSKPESAITLAVLIPWVGDGHSRADCFIMHNLPFEEDLRPLTFPPLLTVISDQENQEAITKLKPPNQLLPDDRDNLAMAELVESMSVTGPLGHLIANPVLQRFYRAVGLAAHDQLTPQRPATQIPASDGLTEAVFEPTTSRYSPAFATAAARVKSIFHVSAVIKAAKRGRDDGLPGQQDAVASPASQRSRH